MTFDALESLRAADFGNYNSNDLFDIQDIKISKSKSARKRFDDYATQIGNPYMFKVGEINVKIHFSPDSKSLNDAIRNAIQNC